MRSAPNKKQLKYLWYFLFAAALIAAIFFGYWHFWWDRFGVPDSPGTAGDMFGALTALFTGFAFAGVIVTMLMQNEDLRLQREELAATREELRGQKEQLIRQNKFIAKQNFESSFFHLLGQLNANIELITLNGYPGRKAIEMGMSAIDNSIVLATGPDGLDVDFVIAQFENLYEQHYEQILGGYFRVLFTVIKFIDSSDVERICEPGTTKWLYIRIVRAQLSSAELMLLTFYGLSKYGKRGMKRLIERFNLVKHLPSWFALKYEPVVRAYQIANPGVTALRQDRG